LFSLYELYFQNKVFFTFLLYLHLRQHKFLEGNFEPPSGLHLSLIPQIITNSLQGELRITLWSRCIRFRTKFSHWRTRPKTVEATIQCK